MRPRLICYFARWNLLKFVVLKHFECECSVSIHVKMCVFLRYILPENEFKRCACMSYSKKTAILLDGTCQNFKIKNILSEDFFKENMSIWHYCRLYVSVYKSKCVFCYDIPLENELKQLSIKFIIHAFLTQPSSAYNRICEEFSFLWGMAANNKENVLAGAKLLIDKYNTSEKRFWSGMGH